MCTKLGRSIRPFVYTPIANSFTLILRSTVRMRITAGRVSCNWSTSSHSQFNVYGSVSPYHHLLLCQLHSITQCLLYNCVIFWHYLQSISNKCRLSNISVISELFPLILFKLKKDMHWFYLSSTSIYLFLFWHSYHMMHYH